MSLQDINKKKQAQGLERNLKGVVHLLEEKYGEFQQLCRVFNPKRGYSPTAIKEIRETYKMSTAKFAEARALQQLIRGRYRAYVQLDQQLQRSMENLSLMYRKDYRFFEQNQSAAERGQQVRKEKALPPRLLSHLFTVYQESPSLPSLILCFQGDLSSLHKLQERVQLGERDIGDTAEGEVWFFLAGVQQPDASILRDKLIETLFEGQMDKVKGVVLKITTGAEAREEALRAMRRGLAGLQEGEIKIL
ncbi:MAG: hypothetical protein MUO24_07065 [Desulfobacterales bacterium]|nr:hypothetical protein [Desulfobacterales bacterium]